MMISLICRRLKTGLIIFVLVFILLQINFLSFRLSFNQNSDSNESNAIILHNFLTLVPHNNNHLEVIKSANTAYTKWNLDMSDIKQMIAYYNQQQTVHNEDVFGPLQNDSIVIVIQIHKRRKYLRHLIVSLAQAPGIAQALVIFSHDYYDEEINNLVQSVGFCKVIQIFYPYSIQTHPYEFPGEDPNDCPRDIKREQALIKKCNNAMHPDLHGHYREAKFTQIKHHWWWKANRVFNQLEVTRNHTGVVVFLEEDHYVAEDFIYVLKLMEKTYKKYCKLCNILSLGTYLKPLNYHINAKKAEISPWISSKHNMGMAFNRSTWMDIVGCAGHFCKYDDYNWDWSLQHISQNCMKRKFHAMVVRGPRVFHIGECGFHYKQNCESRAAVSHVQHVLKKAKKHLYPKYLTVTTTAIENTNVRNKGNGGWADPRDHKLCIKMTL